MKPVTADLTELAQDCILRSANSSNPKRVLDQHFQKAYQLGFAAGQQKGLTQSSEALDTMALVTSVEV